MPVKSKPNQVPRDTKGRFRAGVSGNPSGRPPGAANKLLTLAREGALELWPSVMQAARGGEIGGRKVGREWRTTRGAIDTWLASGKRPADTE